VISPYEVITEVLDRDWGFDIGRAWDNPVLAAVIIP